MGTIKEVKKEKIIFSDFNDVNRLVCRGGM